MKNFLLLLFTWWGKTTFGTWLHTKRFGVFVGQDEFGNKYYKQKVPKNPSYGAERKGERRWVVYANPAEASTIPAGWHGWMHYRSDVAPSEAEVKHWSWERAHQPNMTGTSRAYRPAGSLLAAQKPSAEKAADYEAWSP
ncbi:NADH:ubiquinone oxidoreductase subunit NDUFA12 [uncultured Cohaesibacter sp.]|uniref:NADH:ubiquinone oxidoreductase subunit NDUFA12 n=1 Tax=uncultured Cohaesibacter sp. TaxID=1002546 RepID=UPI0029C7DE95|nr:NADH:ubiquinone oxidoreductase subunit NDUFA12 [uncultured Cohaesibacter sp.]